MKKTAASAMKATRTDAVRAVDRVRWRSWPLDLAASLERADFWGEISDIVLLIVSGRGWERRSRSWASPASKKGVLVVHVHNGGSACRGDQR